MRSCRPLSYNRAWKPIRTVAREDYQPMRCNSSPSCNFEAETSAAARRSTASRFVAATACAALVALGFAGSSAPAYASGVAVSKKAIAVLSGTMNNERVNGIFRFTQEKEGAPVHVIGEVNGLTPGLHGIHIHAQGDVSFKDGSGVGGHFNPSGSSHGDPDGKERHAGDLGNLVADNRGIATIDREYDTGMQLSGSKSIIGRALVINTDPDDYRTQPNGNSGAAIAQGVIGISVN
eukprot:tig00001030_g6462.t1